MVIETGRFSRGTERGSHVAFDLPRDETRAGVDALGGLRDDKPRSTVEVDLARVVFVSVVCIKGDRGKPRVLEERGESNSVARKRERESRREEDAAWVVGERERSTVAREGLLVFRGLLFSANC